LILALLLLSAPSWSAEQLIVYTHHDKPPYFSAKTDSSKEKAAKGIYRTFIDLINNQQDTWYLELRPCRENDSTNSLKPSG